MNLNKKNFFNGISGKMILSLGISITVVLLILSITIYATLKSNIDKMIDNQIKNTTFITTELIKSSVTNSISNYLRAISEKNRDILNSIYKKSQNNNKSNYEEIIKSASDIMLSQIIGKTGYIYTMNSQGVIIIHPKNALIGRSLINYEFIQEQIRMKEGYQEYKWKNPDEIAERQKAAYLTYFEPLDMIIAASSYKEEFNNLFNIKELRKYLLSIKLGDSGYIYIIDMKGNLIIHPTMEGKNIIDSKDDKGRYFIKEMIFQKNGKIEYPWKNPGEKKERMKAVYFSYIEELDMIVASSIYFDDFYHTLNITRTIMIFGLIISLAIIIGIIIFLINRMTDPINNIREVSTNLIERGDLTSIIKVSSNDEIGKIAVFINQIIENFKDLLIKIRESVNIIGTSVFELTSTSQQIAAISSEQAASVKEIVSTMEDSNKLSKNNDIKINEVVNLSNQTKKYVEEGFKLVKDNLAKVKEIKETNANTIQGIKFLGDQIDSIWEIVNIINSIADQTKIIAFNAELEASAAGEAGKNFKIVASEIRRLADNTVMSTKEIKAKINEIQKSSDSLIIASENGTEKVLQGWELTNKLEKVFEEILKSSEIASESSKKIAMSINQQVLSSDQIFLTLKQISESIDNFVSSTKQMTQSANNLKNLTEIFTNEINKYKI